LVAEVREGRPTIIDVLENRLGSLDDARINAVTPVDLQDLADAVKTFYDSWSPPPPKDLRMYAGGWIAGNFIAPEALKYLLTTLVYYPETIFHDPIADWFFPHRDRLLAPDGIWSRGRKMQINGAEPVMIRGNGYYSFAADPERTRQYLKLVAPTIRRLAPLIQAGIVIPVPQWWIVRERQRQILTAVRHDVRDPRFVEAARNPIDEPAPRGDNIRGLGVTPTNGWEPGEEARGDSQDAAYFLNKTLAIAEATSSLYVPPAATDAHLLETRGVQVQKELRRKGVELRLAPALISAELPFLGEVDPDTILAIRRDEPSFADWRAELRNAVRAIGATTTSGEAFEAEAKEVLQDALLPKAREVARTIRSSAAIRGAVKDRFVDVGLGTASLVVTAGVAHQPFDTAALAALGVSGVAHWFLSPLLRESPSGTKAVLAALVKRQRPRRR
jgi:hypothetical protein